MLCGAEGKCDPCLPPSLTSGACPQTVVDCGLVKTDCEAPLPAEFVIGPAAGPKNEPLSQSLRDAGIASGEGPHSEDLQKVYILGDIT